ncbi:hypothetical protein MRB53_016189 [Persea americana]|uniref:Uncharacterized protein n=1 Tax=Persea americana TaxID=3435 RepID=A0ACC2M1I3_PERAE|nr:hypothetical protein MRB53_016189 [Persea americana]
MKHFSRPSSQKPFLVKPKNTLRRSPTTTLPSPHEEEKSRSQSLLSSLQSVRFCLSELFHLPQVALLLNEAISATISVALLFNEAISATISERP